MIQVHDHRVVRRTAFDFEDPSHRGRIRGVGAEPVDRLGRKHDQPAFAQRLDGFLDFGLCSSYHRSMISNEPLHELKVEPAPELEADLTEVADHYKT